MRANSRVAYPGDDADIVGTLSHVEDVLHALGKSELSWAVHVRVVLQRVSNATQTDAQ